jgi:hypothetical protein
MPAKKPKPNEKPQIERFIETAREIGADETQEGFERAFDMIETIHISDSDISTKLPSNAASKRVAKTLVSKK